MSIKLKSEYIGERRSILVPSGIYYLTIYQDSPNTIHLDNDLGGVIYSSVYDFSKDWRVIQP